MNFLRELKDFSVLQRNFSFELENFLEYSNVFLLMKNFLWCSSFLGVVKVIFLQSEIIWGLLKDISSGLENSGELENFSCLL